MPADENPTTGPSRGDADQAYGTGYHVPVLCKAVVSGLITNPDGVYVDSTVGGGGHTAALLDALGSGGRVIGIDRDADALAETTTRLGDALGRGRLVLVRGDFADLSRLVHEAGFDTVDGILMDLGVSSHQFDEATRGFSFRSPGPLDMRMDDRAGVSAWEVVNEWDERTLRLALSRYGEEPRAVRIARTIVGARPIPDTTALADVVRSCVPVQDELKTLARVFQGIRIEVNGELDSLERALEQATSIVRPGGRLAVISYHSLEDRRVKRYLRYGNFEGTPIRSFMGDLESPWTEVLRNGIEADEIEVRLNPRARSARLRLAERTDLPKTDPF